MFDIFAYIVPGLIAGLLLLVLSSAFLRLRGERSFRLRKMLLLAAALCLTIIFASTVSPESLTFPLRVQGGLNLIPFATIQKMPAHSLNIRGNILLFMPVGFLFTLLYPGCRKFLVLLPVGIALSALIEILQLFTPRTTDIDDVILNSSGAVLGYLFAVLLLRIRPSLKKKLGIVKKSGGKTATRHHDAAGIALLIAVSLSCVYVVGGSAEVWERPSGTSSVRSAIAMSSAKPTPSLRPSISPSIRPTATACRLNIEITAKNAYLWRPDTGEVLFDKNGGC